MKILVTAIALMIAAPAAAQASNPHAAHDPHAAHKTGGHEGHKRDCCKDADSNGKMDCCETKDGKPNPCCDEAAVAGTHEQHDGHSMSH
jgi:hypothetical protein